MTTKDQLLDQLREALAEVREAQPVTNSGAVSGDLGSPYAKDTITLSGAQLYNNTVIGGGYTVNSSIPNTSVTAPGAGYVYTSNGTGTATWAPPWGASNTTEINAGQLNLNGKNADVIVNGKSLGKTLEALEQRLNILNPNPELEKEWDELRELGDRYRKLEADLKEKAEMWDKLKKMDPPPLYQHITVKVDRIVKFCYNDCSKALSIISSTQPDNVVQLSITKKTSELFFV